MILQSFLRNIFCNYFKKCGIKLLQWNFRSLWTETVAIFFWCTNSYYRSLVFCWQLKQHKKSIYVWDVQGRYVDNLKPVTITRYYFRNGWFSCTDTAICATTAAQSAGNPGSDFEGYSTNRASESIFDSTNKRPQGSISAATTVDESYGQ